MSDYIVTDTELTETADAIRAKTSDANLIEWESGTGFADAVAAIPSGGNTFENVTGIGRLYACYRTTDKPNVPNKIKLDLPYCDYADRAFSQYIATHNYNLGIEEIEITFYMPVSAAGFMRRNTSIKRVIFPSGIVLKDSYSEFLGEGVESVIGKIGFDEASGTGSNKAFTASTVLKDIEFVENQIPFDMSYNSTVLTDASVLSIANGLSESASAKTLTMPASVKTRMDAMTGTVALDAETQTFHVFTQDAQGTVTLTDFVTNTKGWTLA